MLYDAFSQNAQRIAKLFGYDFDPFLQRNSAGRVDATVEDFTKWNLVNWGISLVPHLWTGFQDVWITLYLKKILVNCF